MNIIVVTAVAIARLMFILSHTVTANSFDASLPFFLAIELTTSFSNILYNRISPRFTNSDLLQLSFIGEF